MYRIRPITFALSTAALVFALATGCGQPSQNQSAPSNQSAQNASNASHGSQDQTSPLSLFKNLHPTTKQWSSPPAMTIDTSKQYDAIVHTNYGDFTIELFAKQSPKTVNNFVFLAKHNFFNDDAFFRIIQSFMIQTGDPDNIGQGGPGYQFADELPPKEKYAPGIVAMANSGPNTNGSEFFICTGQDSESLNQQPNYTIFGKIASGMDIVKKIAAIPVTDNPVTGEQGSFPTKLAYIKSVDIQVH